jgi:predicted TIM-barrel fold metal-dependent hydrolase
MLNRRDLLNLSATAAAASVLAGSSSTAAQDDAPIRIVDSNVSLFDWPFRKLPLSDPDQLLKTLNSLGVTEAWAGSFEGVLHRDISSVNRRLVEACEKRKGLIPIGSVNLELPDWEEDVRRCFHENDMPGVRLHPNYHGYLLVDSRFIRLLKLAAAEKRFIQIAVLIEDTRTQHPSLQTPDVDLLHLSDVMRAIPGAVVQLLNWRPRGVELEELAKTKGVYFDTSRVEGTDGVPNLIEKLPHGRVLFGSHAPFLIPQAAMIRVHESGNLGSAALKDLMSANTHEVRRRSGR